MNVNNLKHKLQIISKNIVINLSKEEGLSNIEE